MAEEPTIHKLDPQQSVEAALRASEQLVKAVNQQAGNAAVSGAGATIVHGHGQGQGSGK